MRIEKLSGLNAKNIKTAIEFMSIYCLYHRIQKMPNQGAIRALEMIFKTSSVYICFNKKHIVSYAIIHPSKKGVYLSELFTKQEYRCRGFAGKLLREIIKSYKKVALLSHEKTIPYYKSLGFDFINYGEIPFPDRELIFKNPNGFAIMATYDTDIFIYEPKYEHTW